MQARIRIAAVSLALLAGVPSAAQAATYRVELTTSRERSITVRDQVPGDTDGATMTVEAPGSSSVVITITSERDSFADVQEPCRKDRLSTIVTCPSTVRFGLDRVVFALGDGDDDVRAGAIPFALTVDARGGGDTVIGGPQDDIIDVGVARERDMGSIFDPLAALRGIPRDIAEGGGGNDRLRQSIPAGTPSDAVLLAKLSGGPGDDRLEAHQERAGGEPTELIGEEGNDTLEGGPGRDRIEGGPGDDQLRGRGGDDHLLPDEGSDLVEGSSGDDLVELRERGPDGADVFSGGTGQDELDYTGNNGGRDEPLNLTPNDQTANDGARDEHDQILGFERVRASRGNDFMFGLVSLDDNLADEWFGDAGDDRMLSGDGDDRLDGGKGADLLRAGSGDDFLFTRDGTVDIEISCSTGRDEAQIDLKDPETTQCERVTREAVNEQPNVRVAGDLRLRRTRGRVRVPLACPKAAKSGCRGKVRLARGTARRTATYGLRAGRSGVVSLRAVPPGAATVTAIQQGARGPKTTTAQVRVR